VTTILNIKSYRSGDFFPSLQLIKNYVSYIHKFIGSKHYSKHYKVKTKRRILIGREDKSRQ
ncbi:hypothetical protein L9F63_006245, partial [Diploptera punctata]